MDQTNEDLVRSHRNGDPDALTAIVKNNLGMIYQIALKEVSKLKMSDIDDLVQIGQISILAAVAKFDFSKGYKFITYASTCIERDIRRYVKNDTAGMVIPASQTKGCSAATEKAKAKARRISSLGYADTLESNNPSPSEICERRDEFQVLNKAIKDLPVELQVPVLLRRLGFPFTKIGPACGITRNRARQRVNQAIEMLKYLVAA